MEIYTEGGCEPNPGNGSWAFVKIHKTGQIETKSGRASEITTNNRMEYTAFIEALKSITNNDESVTVYSDSMLLVNTVNSWMHSWYKKKWKRKKKEIKNIDLVKTIYSLMNGRPNINLKWVRGHNGNKYNEMADALCEQIMYNVSNTNVER